MKYRYINYRNFTFYLFTFMDQELQARTRWASGHGGRCCIAASGGRMSWPPSWKYDVISEIRIRQSMRIYLKNNPAISNFCARQHICYSAHMLSPVRLSVRHTGGSVKNGW